MNVALDELIDRALLEDLGSGDITTDSCVDRETEASAVAIARHQLVVCGGEVFARVFARVDPDTRVELLIADGGVANADAEVWCVNGRARSILKAERVALNLTQRLCGIATMARRYTAALSEGSHTRITDTRKTTPGLRLLERYAVRTGGAHNHRDNLGSAVMIKDNHIAASGSISRAVERAKAYAPHSSRIEVEVTTMAELDEAMVAGADIVMLDNMDTEAVKLALKAVTAFAEQPGHARPIVEVSGGITLERIAELSALGVDVISSGFKAADISLEFALDT